MNKKCNTFIIGASKCGTTSLWHMLNLHPEVFMANPKEPFFFSFSNYIDNMDTFEKLFSKVRNEKIIGEATPIYAETTLIPEIAKRIYEYNPEAKIIYIVRNPIERLKSVWRQCLYTGHDHKSVLANYCDIEIPLMPKKFIDAVYEYPPFLEATKYWTHINNYRKHFKDSEILVLYFEDLKVKPEKLFEEVCGFLEIEHYSTKEMFEVQNQSSGKNRDNRLALLLKKNKLLTKFGKKVKGRFHISEKFFQEKIEYDIKFTENERADVLKILEKEIHQILTYSRKPINFWNNN